jgi:hypothetical protein
MRGSTGWWIAVALLLALPTGTTRAAEEEEEDETPSRLRVSGQLTLSQHNSWPAYFGGDFGLGKDGRTDFNWGEGFARVLLRSDPVPGLQLGVQGIAAGTLGRDYTGVEDESYAELSGAWVRLPGLLGSPLTLTVGRQEIDAGDGFLLGDGTQDLEAATWNIPLRAYDAVRLDAAGERVRLMLLGIRMREDFFQLSYDPEDPTGFALLEPEGEMYGGDVEVRPSADATLGATFLWRSDRGESDADARVGSARFKATLAPLTVGGEFAYEGGAVRGVPLRGQAWHADVRWDLPAARPSYLEGSYVYYSGDREDTEANEEFFPWTFHWSDWSKYYVGDYVSTMLLNADSRIWRLEGGVQATEQLALRALLHRFSLDTGSYVFFLPEGVDHHFADEVDVVVDFTPNDTWSFWVLGSWAAPGNVAKYAWGEREAWQLFLSGTYSFSVDAMAGR